jgi:hypothetical protein
VPASLSDEARERIAAACYDIHKDYAKRLDPLVVRLFEHFSVTSLAGYVEPMPKQPIRLGEILGSYAIALFKAEAAEYPPSPDIQLWFTELVKKVEESIIRRVVKKRSVITGELTYHATEAQMRGNIQVALGRHLGKDRFPVATVTAKDTASIPAGEKEQPHLGLGERLDEARLLENISHEEQADRIGISRTTYFEVKAGRGGQDSKRKTELYLSRLPTRKAGPEAD